MSFRPPMLADKVKEQKLPRGNWVAEIKYDGHRTGVLVRTVDEMKHVHAWSRLGNEQLLSPKMIEALQRLPDGYYDGEIVPTEGGGSSAVKDLSNFNKRMIVLFDVLEAHGQDVTSKPWLSRRAFLQGLRDLFVPGVLELSSAVPVASWNEVEAIRDRVWELGGEGLILKETSAKYECGKRRKCFLKIKQCIPAELRVIGFAPSEGEVLQRGDYGRVVLEDEQGNRTLVKILDDEQHAKIVRAGEGATLTWDAFRLPSSIKVEFFRGHPYDGRILHIEYQERTPDGSYRHPRWDRWDGE